MFKLLVDSWCAESSFQTKTIPSSFLGEYQCCYLIWSRQIHILMIISCVKPFYILQNQSFFQFVPLGYVIFSNRKLQIDGNYIHKMVIKLAFCVVSLLWTSRYVLICCTLLTHFLCCNLFVMFYLTPSAISANVLEIRLPITSIYPFYSRSISSRIPCNRLLQRFSRMFSKFAWITLRYYFLWKFYPFYPPLWATACRSVAVLANFANVLKTCIAFWRTQPPWFLTTKYYDIFLNVCLGTGCLSQGERRGKENSLRKKRVPTDRYIWGCNPQSA